MKVTHCVLLIILWLILSSFSGFQKLKMELVPPIGHTFIVTSAIFSPDDKFILTASGDTKMKIWDAETRKELITILAVDSSDKVIIF